LGVHRVGELAELGEAALVRALGKAHGHHLHELAWARDERPVEVGRAVRSIGHEETFAHDLVTTQELHDQVVRLADGVASRLRAGGTAARTVTLKVRFAGFRTITRSVTLQAPVVTAQAIVAAVAPLLAAVDPEPGVRLLGVSASNLAPPADQLSLALASPAWPAPTTTAGDQPSWVDAAGAMDAIRERFGDAAIGPATAVGRHGLRTVRRGAQQWGPDSDRSGD
jgi:DNA polymerase-4